jgi:hypothetical protein
MDNVQKSIIVREAVISQPNIDVYYSGKLRTWSLKNEVICSRQSSHHHQQVPRVQRLYRPLKI